MKQNNLTPLQQLRREKEALKGECAQSEERLAAYWEYINHNLGSLILSGAVNSVRRQLGFGSSPKADKNSLATDDKDGTGGLLQGLFGGALALSPLIWDMVQPMLMGFVMKKIKSIFTRKKKKKKDD